MPVAVKVKNLGTFGVPVYAKPGDAGCDGVASLEHPVTLWPRDRKLIPLGIQVEIPEGYEIQLRPRSGLALKYGISLGNCVGTVDSGFRNEVGAILINHGTEPFTVYHGDRICQLVLNKFETIQWEEVDELSDSERGQGGFGHSGI